MLLAVSALVVGGKVLGEGGKGGSGRKKDSSLVVCFDTS
jgi:hypothetical protein